MSGKKETTQESSQKRDPWAAAVPGLTSATNTLTNFANSSGANSIYEGDRYAGMGDVTRQGYDNLANNGGFDQSRNYYENILSGNTLSPSNPYLQDLQRSVMSSVMPGVNSTFSRSGMTGSTAHQGVLTRSLTDGMAQPLFSLYENERQRQDNAAAVLPSLYGQNATAQIQSGQAFDQDRQGVLDNDRQVWEERRTAPIRGTMDVLPSLIGLGNVGGTSSGTTTTSQASDPWQTVAGLGGIAAGAAMNYATGGASGALSGASGAMGMFGQQAPVVNPWQTNTYSRI